MASHTLKLALALLGASTFATPVLAQDTSAAVGAEGSPSAEGSVSTTSAEPPPAAPTVDEADRGRIKDPGPHVRPMTLSALAEIPWWHGIGIGIGARFEIPLVKNGPIKSINNQISIEPAFTVGYYRAYGSYLITEDHLGVVYFAPMVYGLWSFHFNERFRAYGGFGMGASIGVPQTSSRYVDVGDETYFRFDPVVGVFYKVGSMVALRGELGGYGPKFGAAFSF